MNSGSYILGFITGLLLVAMVALAIYVIIRKKNGPAKYDERQRQIRGRAYQAAFWVLVAYLCFNGYFQVATGIQWADLMTSSFIGICLAMTVFVAICIKHDAYFAINQKPGLYMILFAGLAAVNLAIGAINVMDDDVPFITGGALNYHIMSFIVAAMLLAAMVVLALKTLAAKRNVSRSEL